MNCRYCVAKDFAGIVNEDLILSNDLIRWLNNSPFMLLVLTGGEPLMPPYDAVSLRLINSIKRRGIIIDTNGTWLPDRTVLNQLKKHNVMVRVSMDSISPEEEIEQRKVGRGQKLDDHSAYYEKLNNILKFQSAGICTAVQTVIWRSNSSSLYQMIYWLADHGIKRWYLQRLIPSHRFKKPTGRFVLEKSKYYSEATSIAKKARAVGIECVAKMDLRHNSVFLLTADGELYTQGNAPGQKVRLGRFHDINNYFDYVSAADHACRYYIADVTTEDPKTRQGIEKG